MSNKVVGVWMDNKHALVVGTENRSKTGDFELIKKIECDDHEGENYKNEKVSLSREALENKKYYKEIAQEIDDCHSIYIFGPGKAQEQFKNVLEDMGQFKGKNIELGSSDKLSLNQIIDRVKAHFD